MRIFETILVAISCVALGSANSSPEKTINVVAATSSTPFDNNDWALHHGYHLKGQTSRRDRCFCTRDASGNNWAILDIELASVTKVDLLNRFDANFAYRLGGITINICQKGVKCEFCGTVPSTAVGQWGSVTCAGGAIKGDQIKLHRPAEALTFCDVNVYGTETYEAVVDVTGAQSSTPFDNNDWALHWGYHVKGQTSPKDKCFCTQDSSGNNWATLDIPFSDVTRVELMSRFDANFVYRTGGIVVEVCIKGGPCKACGTMPAVSTVSTFSSTSCSAGPIKGNQIRLHRPSEALTFCDVNVYKYQDPEIARCVCTDYQWTCPALNDPKFMEDHKDTIPQNVKNQELSCNNVYFQERCPKSCNKCSC